MIMISKGNAEWIKLWMTKGATSFYSINEIKGIYQVHPKKYIIITTECDTYDPRNVIYQDVVAEIDVDTKQTKKMFILESQGYCMYEYNHESSPRFIFSQNYCSRDGRHVNEVYDLYTGFCYKMPDSSAKNKEDIIVCYSSKEVIVLQINQGYYLYINGCLVYQYTSEEYESILYNLRNKIKITKHSCTVIIGKNLCIWNKKEKPEMITL